jgi:hypothetical protein
MVAVDLGILYSAGGWWKIAKDTGSSYRWENISRNPKMREMFLDAIARHFRKNYYTLNIVYEKLGLTLGKLSEQDLKERDVIYEKNVSKPIFSDKGEVKVETKEETKEKVKEEVKEETSDAPDEEDVFELDPDDVVNDDTPIVLTEDPIILDVE